MALWFCRRESEEEVVSRLRPVDSGLQTYEYARKTDVDKNDDDESRYVGDYLVPEKEEFAQFDDSHFRTIARHYLS
jgi:hypothetical protein